VPPTLSANLDVALATKFWNRATLRQRNVAPRAIACTSQEHVPLAWYEGMASLLAEIKGLAQGGRARLDA
jgi:hypothetical protein